MQKSPIEKSQSIWIKQLSRFASIGVLATIIHTLAALVTIQFLQFNSMQANVSAFLLATLFSYSFNSVWSFEKPMNVGSFTRFVLVGISNLCLILVLSNINDRLGYPPELSVFAIAITMPIINFIIHKFWTFRNTT